MDYIDFKKKVLEENQEIINKKREKDEKWFYIYNKNICINKS